MIDPAILQDPFAEKVVNTNQLDNSSVINGKEPPIGNGKTRLKLYYLEDAWDKSERNGHLE